MIIFQEILCLHVSLLGVRQVPWPRLPGGGQAAASSRGWEAAEGRLQNSSRGHMDTDPLGPQARVQSEVGRKYRINL